MLLMAVSAPIRPAFLKLAFVDETRFGASDFACAVRPTTSLSLVLMLGSSFLGSSQVHFHVLSQLSR